MAEQIFANSIQKTNLLLNKVQNELALDDKRHAYALVRAVLHHLRDRLPIEEAVDFGAQLSIIMRGVFYEGWRPSQVPIKMDKEEFLQAIDGDFEFELEESIEEVVQIIFDALRNHVDPHEIEKISAILPKKFDDLF